MRCRQWFLVLVEVEVDAVDMVEAAVVEAVDMVVAAEVEEDTWEAAVEEEAADVLVVEAEEVEEGVADGEDRQL